MLSFQVRPWFKGQGVQIDCDDAGLQRLIEALQEVQRAGHLHLRAPSSGGAELSDVTPFGQPAIGNVIITTGGD